MRQNGLEPSTSPLSGVCSSQLSYWRRGGEYSSCRFVCACAAKSNKPDSRQACAKIPNPSGAPSSAEILSQPFESVVEPVASMNSDSNSHFLPSNRFLPIHPTPTLVWLTRERKTVSRAIADPHCARTDSGGTLTRRAHSLGLRGASAWGHIPWIPATLVTNFGFGTLASARRGAS